MVNQDLVQEFKERISSCAHSVLPSRLCREVVTLVEDGRRRLDRQRASILKYQEGEATAHATIADLRARNDQQRETDMWQFEERARLEELAYSLAKENVQLKAQALDATILQEQAASLREQLAQVAQLESERDAAEAWAIGMYEKAELWGGLVDAAQKERDTLQADHAALLGLVQAYVEARDEADKVSDNSDCDIWQAAYRALCAAEDALRAPLAARPAAGLPVCP